MELKRRPLNEAIALRHPYIIVWNYVDTDPFVCYWSDYHEEYRLTTGHRDFGGFSKFAKFIPLPDIEVE